MLVLTGAWSVLWDAVPPHGRALLWAVAPALVLPMGAVARDIARDFAPYSATTLAYDRGVTGWAMVPAEIRTFLEHKRAAWDARRERLTLQEAVPIVTEGLHAWEEQRGERFRWARTLGVQLGPIRVE